MKHFFRPRGIRPTLGLAKSPLIAAAFAGGPNGRKTVTTTSKKRRLRTILVLAAALGCSSTVMSGMLAAFAIQQPGAESGVA